MADISSFRNQLRVYELVVINTIARSCIHIAQEIQASVAFKTPIETGAAKDSWNLASPVPNLAFKDRRGTGQGPGGRYGYWNPDAPPLLEHMIETFTLGQPLHISNNVPYINILNSGGKHLHFVETAMAEAIAGVIR